MRYYELFQLGPAVYIPILLLSLAITVVAYGAFPVIFAKLRKTYITKKKYRRLCYGINAAVMLLFIIINGEASSGGPYLLWTWVFSSWGIKILDAKGIFTEGIFPTNTTHDITDKESQINMLNNIIDNRMTVRQLDSEIKELLNPSKSIIKETEIEQNYINDLSNKIELDNNEIKEEDAPDLSDKEIEKLIFDTRKALQERYELFDIPTAEEIKETNEEEKEENNSSTKIVPGNMDSIITKFKELEAEIEKAGFRIETEDYDFEDLYQIIIKIEK